MQSKVNIVISTDLWLQQLRTIELNGCVTLGGCGKRIMSDVTFANRDELAHPAVTVFTVV